ncbi:hypothetical protein GOP47_0030438 [Adiantum capillus-veneris]|nr:hypothetical protein GOP47_0030438 [Adiantum capillus-veneris]
MAEAEAAPKSEEIKNERSWARVATHLEGAIAAIPRPNWQAITNPKEMAKNLKQLCKSLKKQLKEVFQEAKDMSHRIYTLLSQLASKLADLISAFFNYICDKVKSFFKWISGIVQRFKAKFSHAD